MRAQIFLSRAFLLDQRVQSKLQQIEALRSLACRITPNIGTEPVSHSRNMTAMQDTVVKIMEEEERLNREIDWLVDAKREIAEVISRVPDETLRLILEKRHLLYRQWFEIAADLGITERWAQIRHREAVEAVQRVLDEREDE